GRPTSASGSSVGPSLCMASITTRAIMSFSPPSALYQPMRLQNSFDRAWLQVVARVGGHRRRALDVRQRELRKQLVDALVAVG
ncbi:MAG: hypothetical protein OXE40_17105, partial [Gammaproteobacteria bacterium]|nr:hypothetical protein [Gammaproteobacteria bacterium]